MKKYVLINNIIGSCIGLLIILIFGFSSDADKYFLTTAIISTISSLFQSYWQTVWFSILKQSDDIRPLIDTFWTFATTIAFMTLMVIVILANIGSTDAGILCFYGIWLLIACLTPCFRILCYARGNFSLVYKTDFLTLSTVIILVFIAYLTQCMLFAYCGWLLRELMLFIALRPSGTIKELAPRGLAPVREGKVLLLTLLSKPLLLLDKLILSFLPPGTLSVFSASQALAGIVQKVTWQAKILPTLASEVGLLNASRDFSKLVKTMSLLSLMFAIISLSSLFYVENGSSIQFFFYDVPLVIIPFLFLAGCSLCTELLRSYMQQFIFATRFTGKYLFLNLIHEYFWSASKIILFLFIGPYVFIYSMVASVLSRLLIFILLSRSYLN